MKKTILFLAILFTAYFSNAQTIPVTNSVTLDASKSIDADGTITTYSWKQESGTATTITNGNTSKATIAFTVSGSYSYSLTVTDNDGGSNTVNISIKVDDANKLPTAIITINGVVVSSYEIKLPSK